jgi:hypothetical protein
MAEFLYQIGCLTELCFENGLPACIMNVNIIKLEPGIGGGNKTESTSV